MDASFLFQVVESQIGRGLIAFQACCTIHSYRRTFRRFSRNESSCAEKKTHTVRTAVHLDWTEHLRRIRDMIRWSISCAPPGRTAPGSVFVDPRTLIQSFIGKATLAHALSETPANFRTMSEQCRQPNRRVLCVRVSPHWRAGSRNSPPSNSQGRDDAAR
jgi:hypothetical protein